MKKFSTQFVLIIIITSAVGIMNVKAQSANDAGIKRIIAPLCTPVLSVTLANLGTNDINKVNVGWSVNGAYQTPNSYNQLLKSGDSFNFTISPNYNLINGSTYAIRVFTYSPNNVTDGNKKNDTSKLTFKYYATANNPGVTDFVKCGPGKASLKAIPGNVDDSIVWYNAAVGGSIITKGKNALSPSLSYGVDTFFAQAFKLGSVCPSSRVALKVTVNPSPNGAAFIKGTPFESTQPNTTGTAGDPDIVAKGRRLTYNLTPPTGYTNADYGTKWTTITPNVKTLKGINIPSGAYWSYTPPTSTAAGTFVFNADESYVDSCLMVTMQLKDLGPYFCDSTIYRYTCVAPSPYANFISNSPVCDGDSVVFTNRSKIASGTISYKWDFGTGKKGDTANTTNATFRFPSSGTYYVKLTSTSNYKISDSLYRPVAITEPPNSGFKYTVNGNTVIFNAEHQSGIRSYHWDFGDGGKGSLVDTQHVYATSPVNYKVCLTVTALAGCVSDSCQTLLINEGINSVQISKGFSIYPIPNSGNFILKIENPQRDISIQIYDALGQVIKAIGTNTSKSLYPFDLNVAKGIYLVKVINGGLISTQKIMIND